MNSYNEEVERIKNIIDNKITIEFKLERNNPDSKAKRNNIIKTNYLKERLTHLRSQIMFSIDNPGYIKKTL